MFDIGDMRKCCECENAKPKESFHDENGNIHQLWFCGKHKQFITELTLVQSTCKGKDYKTTKGGKRESKRLNRT